MTNDRYSTTIGYYSSHPSFTKSEVEFGISTGDISEADIVVAEQYRTETFDADLIPDVRPDTRQDGRQEVWDTMDAILDALSLGEAYDRWCGKTKRNGRKRQLLSCPNPSHPDADPSASFSFDAGDSGLWSCKSSHCGVAGDKYDIAALHFGFPVPEYRARGNTQFHEVCTLMLADLGWTTDEAHPKAKSLFRKEGASTASAPEASSEIDSGEASSTEPEATDDDVEEMLTQLDWHAIVTPGTPLDAWMQVMTPTDIPDEYLLWNGFIALALTAGRNVYLLDTPHIYPSLFVMLFGATGTMKSLASGMMQDLLLVAEPFEEGSVEPHGVMAAGNAASGEGIFTTMAPPIEASDDPRREGVKVNRAQRVKALWYIDELSSLLDRKSRQGNTIQSALIELYDTRKQMVLRRSKASDSVIVIEPFACVVATTQPQAIAAQVTMQDVWSGFLNRWVPVTCTIKPKNRRRRYVADLTVAARAFKQLADGWCSVEHAIEMTEEALDIWEPFAVESLDPLTNDDINPMAHVYGRVELLMRKLMLILCINEKRESIDADIVTRALSMWPYILNCYDSLCGRVSAANSSRDMAWELILGLYDKAPDHTLTSGQLNREIKKRHTVSFDDAMNVHDRLIRSGSVIELIAERSPKGGRPTRRFKCVD